MDIMTSKNIYYFCWALSKGRSKGIQWKITIAWMRHERSFRSTVLTNVFAPWMILLYRGGRVPRCWTFEDFFFVVKATLHLDALHVNRILKDVESFVDFSIVKYEEEKNIFFIWFNGNHAFEWLPSISLTVSKSVHLSVFLMFALPKIGNLWKY